MLNSSNPPVISSTVKLQVIIEMLSIIIKIGKNLPLIVFTFATLNLTLAILDFTIWNSISLGVLNTILAIGGFVFSGQLQQRHNIYRHEDLPERTHGTVGKQPEEVLPRMTALE